MGVEYTDDCWKTILDRVNPSSSSVRQNPINLKVVHAAHLSNSTVHKIDPDNNLKRDSCGTDWSEAHVLSSNFKVF